MYTYLLLLLASIAFPVSYSFESKIAFYKRWTSLFVSIAIVALFFIVWDIYFTRIGVWSFNPQYILGIYISELPLEECLFFIFIPYSCVFIYESLNYFIKEDYLKKYSKFITIATIVVLVAVAIMNTDKAYTFVTFILTASFLGFHYVLFKDKYLGRFYVAYLVHLIPFFIVNGILTSYPVVVYNDQENLGIRLGTVPIEDSMYSLLMLLMNITLYEYFNGKKFFVKNNEKKIMI